MSTQTRGVGRFDPQDRFHRFQARLGEITLAASSRGLRGLWFAGQNYFPNLPTGWRDDASDVLAEAERQLHAYFAGERRAFDVPLDLSRGTDFQQSVWNALRELPWGETTTYAALAARLNRSRAVRAVGAAIGRNPISVIVPCHRVLGSDGSLTGYAGGLERKVALLRIEGHQDRAA